MDRDVRLSMESVLKLDWRLADLERRVELLAAAVDNLSDAVVGIHDAVGKAIDR